MACYHPLKGFRIGTTVNGKPDYKVCSSDVHHLELINNYYVKCYDEFVSPSRSAITDFIYIPCGQCIGCRLDYAKLWSDRCMFELQYHKHSYFLTLTYDNYHIPMSCYLDDDGCVNDIMSLRKKDVSVFMKDLRNYLHKTFGNDYPRVRFFCAGEYGGTTFRPHYHMILYGFDIPDLVFYKRSDLGDNYYTSKLLESIWDKGFCIVGAVTPKSCNYVARYITKKHKGAESDFYNKFNIQPEFTLMSRRPGIGKQYYDDHKYDFLQYDRSFIKTDEGGFPAFTPRYFRNLIELDDSLDDITKLNYSCYRENRVFAHDEMLKIELNSCSYTHKDFLKSAELALINKTKVLKRGDLIEKKNGKIERSFRF